MRLTLLTILTMIAFAANSVFGRLGLETASGTGSIDPASYSLIRLASGAIMLGLLVVYTRGVAPKDVLKEGNWISAMALFGYAAAFSYSYIAIRTGLGALVLFASVQATMIGWAILTGARPTLTEQIGLAVAFTAFVWLVSPGLEAPPPMATVLMALAGISWGIYSIRGKGETDPLKATAGNFIRSNALVVVLAALAINHINLSPFGIMMAVLSGAITSALGYSLWYEVLKTLSATQSAIVQLSVPVIAGFGGLILLGEPITQRFTVASFFILGGIALAIFAKTSRRRA